MHFVNRIEVSAPPEKVWSFIWQTEDVCACLPGCEAVRTIEDMQRYEATVEERVGPFKARFAWEISIESATPLRQVRLLARGKDPKLGATARAELSVLLAESEQAGTALDIETELLVTGKVATLGHAVIKRKADQVVRDFASGLEARLDGLQKSGNGGRSDA
jgi:carbon monoxide dehydrogenase subunit G